MPRVTAPSSALPSEWLAARASLAGRRIGRFALGAVATFLSVLLVLLVIPQLGISVSQTKPLAIEPREDTIPLLRASADAQRALARADSVFASTGGTGTSVDRARAQLSIAQRAVHDSLQALVTELDSLLNRSAIAPLQASYLALRFARGLAEEPQAVLLTDSLAALQRRRAALSPGSGTEHAFADVTAQMNEVGSAIRAVAERRRDVLTHDLATVGSSTGSAVGPDSTSVREARDTAQARWARAASQLTTTRLRNAGRDRRQVVARDRANRRIPPIAMLAASTVLAMITGFSVSLFTEIARPTVASAREAEAIARCPVTLMRREEFSPETRGIDPFRMLYLELTAIGARAATVEICGEERAVVATVAGRLALAAATEASATLVVDADAEGSPVAGYYRQRPEPGFTDAVAGVRLWREVTQSVGASNGLSIDIVPGGSLRREEADSATQLSAQREFARFRDEYDFCIAVATSATARARLDGLLQRPFVLICAVVGRTTLASLASETARLSVGGTKPHGVALWDLDIPYIPFRNELMASG